MKLVDIIVYMQKNSINSLNVIDCSGDELDNIFIPLQRVFSQSGINQQRLLSISHVWYSKERREVSCIFIFTNYMIGNNKVREEIAKNLCMLSYSVFSDCINAIESYPSPDYGIAIRLSIYESEVLA